MFKEKILPLEQCVKVGGNKYGKPTECCGTSFPNMIPKQQVQIQKKKQFFKIFIDSHSNLYFRENSAVVTDRSTRLHVNAVVEIKFVQSAKGNEFIKR